MTPGSITWDIGSNIIAAGIVGVCVWTYRVHTRHLRRELEQLIGLRTGDAETRDLVARTVVLAAQADASAKRCEEKLNLLLLAMRDNA